MCLCILEDAFVEYCKQIAAYVTFCTSVSALRMLTYANANALRVLKTKLCSDSCTFVFASSSLSSFITLHRIECHSNYIPFFSAIDVISHHSKHVLYIVQCTCPQTDIFSIHIFKSYRVVFAYSRLFRECICPLILWRSNSDAVYERERRRRRNGAGKYSTRCEIVMNTNHSDRSK